MGLWDSSAFHRAFYPLMNRHEDRRHEMNGREWRAAVRLTDREGKVVADAGGTCERVNPSSLPVLRDIGWITPVPVDADNAVEGEE